MITSVVVNNLRGVRSGHIDGLSPLSIVVGPNNSGKSTLLEAVAIGLADDAGVVIDLVLRRGGPPTDALNAIVSRGADNAVIDMGTDKSTPKVTSLRAELSPNARRDVELVERAQREGLLSDARCVRLVSEVIGAHGAAIFHNRTEAFVDSLGKKGQTVSYDRYGEERLLPESRFVDVEAVRGENALENAHADLERARRIPDVVAVLRRSMPALTDLRIIRSGGRFVLHAVPSGDAEPIPAFVSGDGFKRVLKLAAATLARDVKVVLLEEPESFQHPRYLDEIAGLLSKAALDRQIILSTHSIELIDRLLHVESDGNWPSVHRVKLIDGELRAVTLDKTTALAARDDLLEDLRT